MFLPKNSLHLILQRYLYKFLIVTNYTFTERLLQTSPLCSGLQCCVTVPFVILVEGFLGSLSVS